MAKFKKGDVCIVLSSMNFPKMVGEEVVLSSNLVKGYSLIENRHYFGYKTDIFENNIGFMPEEHQLRLRDAPPDAIVMREYNRLIEKITGKVPA